MEAKYITSKTDSLIKRIMKRIVTIISAMTTVLAFYNEARKAGLVEDLIAKYLPSSRKLDPDFDE
jgi:hypothetical protein